MALSVEHVSKSFGKKLALSDINVKLSGGAIHAFVGENGAGKSTLAKLISGKIFPDDGRITKDENEKIVFVEQRPVVAESIKIKENIFLGIKETKENNEKLKSLVKKICPNLNVNAMTKDSGGSERFYASLLNCLLRDFTVLILDEPGAYLTVKERDVLFENLSELKKQNKNIIVITHAKKEIIKYSDDIFLLKKGKLIFSVSEIYNKTQSEKEKILETIEKSIKESSAEIFGQERLQNTTETVSEKKKFVFECENLSCAPLDMPLIYDVSFSAESGSVVLVKGLNEAGLLTLENCITGMASKIKGGRFIFSAENKRYEFKKLTPEILRKKLNGLLKIKTGIVPSDKTMRGTNPELTVSEMMYPALSDVSFNEYDSFVEKIIERSGVNIRKDEKVKSLSGGMLQRLMLERELFSDPDFVILCQPLTGLDMFKTKIICEKIMDLKKKNCAVLVLSSEDLPDNIADKVFFLSGGTLC